MHVDDKYGFKVFVIEAVNILKADVIIIEINRNVFIEMYYYSILYNGNRKCCNHINFLLIECAYESTDESKVNLQTDIS